MKPASSILALALGLSFPLPALATDPAGTAATAPAVTIAIVPVPGWIATRQIPEATPDRLQHADGGTAYLLSDYQLRLDASGHESWYRSAARIVDRSGLEGSGQIDVSFDPRVETVGIAFIHLIRDGKVIDLTAETRFRVVERENDLADGIISGTLRAVANLRDVRVGDIVDYATVTRAKPLLWPGHLFESFTARYSQPLAAHSVRYLVPAATPLQIRSRNADIAFVSRRLGDEIEWQWQQADAPPQQGEGDVPGWHPQWGRVEVSTMKSWAEVAQWASALYVGDEALPADFAAKLDAIAAKWPAQADRLTEATRLVQDSIRYVGEEMGEGSYVPRRPKTVIERGYGDCKDKALLLALALRRLGIAATPALVSTTPGLDLPERLPSPLAFDHVIVRAELDGKPVWIDATGTHRGGRGAAIAPSNLGFALPLRAGTTALEAMSGYDARAGGIAVTERFEIDEAAPTALTLHVETRHTGAMADWFRARVASRSARTIEQDNTDYYRKRFPGLATARPLELRDDRDANVLVMVEDYTLAKADFEKGKIGTKLSTTAYLVDDILPARQPTPRTQPLQRPANLERVHTVILSAKDRHIGTLEDFESSAGGITFSRRTTRQGDGTTTVWKLASGPVRAVPPADAEAVYALQKAISDRAGIDYNLEDTPRPSEAAGTVDAQDIAPYRADFDKAVALAGKGDQAALIEALSLLGGILEKLPHPSPAAGLIEGVRGGILAGLMRPLPALTALRAATEQFAGNPAVFRMRIAFEIDAGTPETTLQALRLTQMAQPAIVGALDQNWVIAISQKQRALPPEKRETAQQELCTLLVEAEWQQNPRTQTGNQMLGCALRARATTDPEAARTLLARQPAADDIASLAMNRRYKALWPDLDKLGADGFRKAIEREVANAAAAAKAAPKDWPTLTRHVHALRAAGRLAEAIALAKPFATDRKTIETLGENGFWLVNEYSAALAQDNRRDEALAALDSVLALGLENYPALLSQAINRAGLLLSMGRDADALAAYAAVLEKSDRHLSQIGRMFVWSGMACAQRNLGQIEAAAANEAKLATRPADNWTAATIAAACRGDNAGIARMLVTRLAESESRDAALGLFIRFTAPEALTAFDQRLRKVMAAALADPAVQAEFRKQGRPITYAGTRAGWSEF